MKLCTRLHVNEISDEGVITSADILDISLVDDAHPFGRQANPYDAGSFGFLHLEGTIQPDEPR